MPATGVLVTRSTTPRGPNRPAAVMSGSGLALDRMVSTSRPRSVDTRHTRNEPSHDRNGDGPLPALTRVRGVPIDCSGVFG